MDIPGPHDGAASAPAPEPAPSTFTSVVKRLFDVLVSATALVLTLPILAVAAIAIRIESRGPIICRNVRVGRDGVAFEMYRLRSTVADSREPGVCGAGSSGDQVTRVGRVLRWASIDELPQLWNVLRGDMSVVGPQPMAPVEPPDGPPASSARRLRAVPGLTGTWADDASKLGHGAEPRHSGNGSSSEHGDSDHRAG